MAKVARPFSGVPDGEVYPREFVPGDEVVGGLAAVAEAMGWLEKSAAPKRKGK